MHMISDFMHFDNIAFRQKKNAIWKVDGYNIRSVYTQPYACIATHKSMFAYKR